VNKAHESPNTGKSRFSPNPRRRSRWLRALAGSCLAIALTSGPALASSAAAGVSDRIIAQAANATCPPPSVERPEFALKAIAENRQVELSWSESGQQDTSTHTTIRYCSETGQSGQLPTPPAAKSAPVTKLTNGITYYFWLVDDKGTAVSNTASATPAAPPGQPTGLTAAPGDSKVTLSWAAPGSDGGAQISHYVVREGTRPGGESDAPVRGSPVGGTSTTVTGLANGTTYYFTVTAANSVGLGPASAEVLATPRAAPGAVGGLTTIAGNGQVIVSWNAPVSSGGLPVTGYHLYAGTSDDFTGKAPLIPLTGTAATVTGLVNGTTYYFKVTAVNGAGDGPGSETEAVPVTTPEAPTKLTATPGKSQVTLSWTAPASDGGTGIINYIVSEGTSPGGETGEQVSGSPVSGTSTTVTGLHNGTTYYFTVAARNAAGLSSQSGEASAALPPIVITSSPPSRATTPPGTATPSGTASPPDTATPNSAASTSNATNQSSGPTQSTGPTAPSSPTQSSIDAESTSNTSIPALTPPTGLTATPGKALAYLSWTPPLPSGGPPVKSYNIYYSTDPGLRTRTPLSGIHDTAGNVGRLVSGTVYYFVVTAVNAAGEESPTSTEVSAEPNGPPPKVHVGLGAPLVPAQLAAVLTAVAALAVAGVSTLIARHRRGRRPGGTDSSEPSQDHPGQQAALVPDVRAVPNVARPETVHVSNTGQQPTHTVRLEPHSGARTTMIKEAGHDDRRGE
jgi:YHS domain-containing protein